MNGRQGLPTAALPERPGLDSIQWADLVALTIPGEHVDFINVSQSLLALTRWPLVTKYNGGAYRSVALPLGFTANRDTGGNVRSNYAVDSVGSLRPAT